MYHRLLETPTQTSHEQTAPERTGQGQWLLVIYRVPAEPSSARTAI